MKDHPESHTIIVTVLNRVGVIARITGLFSARGYNIENIIAAPTETNDIYKVYIGVLGTESEIEQVVKQLHKLIDTLKVTDISHKNNYIVREFMMMKVNCPAKSRTELVTLVETFRAKIVDVAPDSVTIDLSGPSKKIERLIDLIRPWGIQELVRTGKVAIAENQ